MQHGDQLALATNRLTLVDAALGVLVDGARPPHVDLAGERGQLSIPFLDDLTELDDVNEVVHREEAQRADGIRAVRLIDGLGLEERLGQPLLAATHEVERRDIILDLERWGLGRGWGVQRNPDGPWGQN